MLQDYNNNLAMLQDYNHNIYLTYATQTLNRLYNVLNQNIYISYVDLEQLKILLGPINY
jgi:hypothetical protein